MCHDEGKKEEGPGLLHGPQHTFQLVPLCYVCLPALCSCSCKPGLSKPRQTSQGTRGGWLGRRGVGLWGNEDGPLAASAHTSYMLCLLCSRWPRQAYSHGLRTLWHHIQHSKAAAK